jgi:SMC interacting uncharacterized protein involved in chromosome segregation
MIDRAQVESFLNFANKLAGAQEIAKALMQISDLEAEITTHEARLASAVAREQQFVADTERARIAERQQHADNLQRMTDEAKAAVDRQEARLVEAHAAAARKQAEADAQHEQKVFHATNLLNQKMADLNGLNADLADTDELVARRRAELAEVEAKLVSAREAIANLMRA